MAVGKYLQWLEPENLTLLQGWKRDGLTDEQIAHNIGINPRTLEKWKRQHGQIRRALKIGKTQANFYIENQLFKKAANGNMTAIIFWLKNNWRDKYNDSQLSVEERELAKQRAKKLQAETEIAQERAKLLKEDNSITKIVFNDDLKRTSIEDDEEKDNGNGN